MGSSSWNDAAASAHRTATATRAANPSAAFTYSQTARATGAGVHEALNPYGKTRESRDSDAHPVTLPIAVIFDETGSMMDLPPRFVLKLGALMRMLVEGGNLADGAYPAVLFGAVGDAFSDRAPLQVGQFESGLEMDDDLTRVYLEGGGGGQGRESYELAAYFLARHTASDAWEKRGKKGYVFITGDERVYPYVRRDHVASIIGDTLEADLSTEEVFAELQRRYEVFFLFAKQGSYTEQTVLPVWRDLLGERALVLDDAETIAETIALQIALCEGTHASVDAASNALTGAGFDPRAVLAASRAVVPYASSAAVTRVRSALPVATDASDDGRF